MKLHWNHNDDVRKLLTLHRNPIFHPATCIRTYALKAVGGWPVDCGQAEDYGLWCALIGIGRFAAFENLWTYYSGALNNAVPRQFLVDIVAERMGW